MKIPDQIEKEFRYKTSRSRGAGGQNVNKVETKVELLFNISESGFLTDEQKQILNEKLRNRVNKEGLFAISSESERTQIGNKKKVIQKFFQLIEKALLKKKPRVPTKISKSAKEKRLTKKKIHSEKKKLRRMGF